MEAQLRQSLQETSVRATQAERQRDELNQQLQAQMSTGRSCREQLESLESQLRDSTQEIRTLRENQKQLELLKYQHERELGENKVQLQGLQEQLAVKEQLVKNQAALNDTTATQRQGLEESLTTCRQQLSALDNKFAQAAQEIAKGNEIIQSLRTSNKQTKAKLRLKQTALAQQEKSQMELERADEVHKHLIEEKELELSRAKSREEHCKDDISELRKKLSEAHEALKSNQDVIEYLNRQLTERDMKSLPSMPASSILKRVGTSLGKDAGSLSVGKIADMPSSSATSALGDKMGFASMVKTPTDKGLDTIHNSSPIFPSSVNSGDKAWSDKLPAGMPAFPKFNDFVPCGATFASVDADWKQATMPSAAAAISAAAALAASASAGRSPLRGPVAYRSPDVGAGLGLLAAR